jgi:hypothetical protein
MVTLYSLIHISYLVQTDGIQWLVDTSPRRNNWNADRLVGEIMGVWYGSVHTLAIVGATTP